MSSVVDVACPSCGKTLKVPPTVLGKKVKCKQCAHVFVVRDPGGDGRPSRPARSVARPATPAAAAPPPPPEPAKPKSPFLDDDDEGVQKVELVKEEDAPRCPHCAQELVPPDAKVCIHCGFNNVTRTKAETKRVWEPDAQDWALHLLPGIVTLLVCIGLIVWGFVVYFNMRDWMVDSFLELDSKDATGKKKYIVPPGFFITLNFVISLAVFVPCAKFAFRRLVKEYRPPERLKA
jgi:hypothetical protein